VRLRLSYLYVRRKTLAFCTCSPARLPSLLLFIEDLARVKQTAPSPMVRSNVVFFFIRCEYAAGQIVV
jgi:hypothetical protein